MKSRKAYIAVSLFFFFGVFGLQFCSEPEKEKESDELLEFLQDEQITRKPQEHHEYIGSKACADCHYEIYESFQETGKGRAFHYPSSEDPLVDFSNIHVYDRYSDFHYTGFWKEGSFYVKEYRIRSKDTLHQLTRRADFVVGSGNQTRSFLYHKNGYLFEMPITWYVKKGIWDLSPGYEDGANTRFDRAMGQQCINCHNSGFEFVDNSLNLFPKLGVEGIGCEKCHGPGGSHMDQMLLAENERGEDPKIVHPGKLPLDLQFDVCRQCHLEGVTVEKAGKHFMDFRPGEPLTDYWEVFIPTSSKTNDFGFASHVERLQKSACFIGSSGEMNCTTCHDPHKALPDDKVLFYQQRCLNCHQMEDCGEEHFSREEQGNNCVSCHMPKGGTTDIPHVSSTDHFIRIVEEGSIEDQGSGDGLKEFLIFSSSGANTRDMAMANLEYYEKFSQEKGYLDRVANYLESIEWKSQLKYYYFSKAPIKDPSIIKIPVDKIDDPYSAFYIAELRKRQGLSGLSYYKKARELAPQNVDFNFRLGMAYLDINDWNEAKRYFEDVLSKIPWHEKALVNYGFILLGEGHYESALHITQKAIDNNPDYTLARENKVNILLNLERKLEAKTELDILISQDPNNEQYLKLRSSLLEAG